ncbi:hypothetical protein J4H92_07170 [Leucobacter weissii]|uniref:Alkaline shock response membrane anchor protein AmaP n=1 Tax=Leucobacter weissii TaxID=1983706 RepID=A0A939MNB7_9MICO|nr:hypothetical protein [Leucobacter weissii]MBO1901732.1 hypothetical protein [Leucobacter weissii]
MNATNRGVNRTVLLVAGLVLVVVGGSAVVASLWPPAGEIWESGLSSAATWMLDADRATRISESTAASWFAVALLALLLLIVLIAVVVIARLGGGRSGVVIRAESGEGAQGPVTIRQGFVADAITHALAEHDEVLSSRVSAHRVRGADVLHVRVTPRQNASPSDLAETVARLLDNLAVLTGREIPSCVSIRSGVRSRLAADQARVR